MTNNINWANKGVKAGFTGYTDVQPIYIQNFANQPNYSPQEQKEILADLSNRYSIDEPSFLDDKPYAYKLMEETGVDNTEVIKIPPNPIDYSFSDDLKNVQNLTLPPEKDETKEVLMNGALVVLGVIILVKILS